MYFLQRIERFMKETGMAPARFGREAARDPRLVFDFRNGREPGPRMRKRIEHFMNIYLEQRG